MSTQLKAQVDKLLTGVSSKYQPKNFVCEQILPEIKSKQNSGKLGKYGTAHLRIENTVVGGRGKYRRIETRQYSTQTYNIEGHGLEGMVTKEDYRNVEDPFKAEQDETIGVSTVLWLEKEKMLADTLSDVAVMTNNLTLSGSDQFSDYAGSDPLGVISTAVESIISKSGDDMDLVAIMDKLVYNKLRFHPQLLDNLGFKFNRPGGLSPEEIAKAFGVEKIIWGSARYESAKEGQASALAPVWGKHLILARCPAKASIEQVSIGYMIRPEDGSPRKVYKQSNFNPPGSTSILVEDEYDMLISNTDAGYLIKDVIA
jgi:hypothetical protein